MSTGDKHLRYLGLPVGVLVVLGLFISPALFILYGACKKRSLETLWRDFFMNTSQWWDHRPEKTNPRFPDFKHKQTKESLWVGGARNPPWVQAKLASIPPGTLQSNVFAWTQRLKKLVKARDYIKTMEVFHQMQQERIYPDTRTFLPVLNACAHLGALEEGRRVHRQIIQAGCESNVYVSTCLVDMYTKCGSIEDAWIIFDKMCERNVVTWNTMIRGHVKSAQELKAIELFRQMQQEGVEPDAITFVGVLNAYTSIVAIEDGRDAHKQIKQVGYESDVYVSTCLVDMYAKCGSIEDAWSVFNKMQKQDVVPWNAMIGGYVKSGQEQKALALFQQMGLAGVEPDTVTFVAVLNACASVFALEEGRHIHEQVIQRGCESNINVANCLVDMYAKCGRFENAWSVFSKMSKHDVVTWNAMIGGHVKSGQELKAMELFKEMQEEGVEPDAVTFIGILNACTSVLDLEAGRCVHKQIVKVGCESDVYVANCLVDMYGKCGSIQDAWSVFEKIPQNNVVTWNSMIGIHVKSGQGLKAIELFQTMQQKGVEPDTVAFIGVLNACASVAALEEGRRVHKQIMQFGCMSDVYVATCLVDMYAKCGSIEDARTVFNTMQGRNMVTWNTMIGGFAMHGQANRAISLFRQMGKEGIEMDGVTFTCLLSACSHGGLVKEGRRYFKSMSSCLRILPSMENYASMVDLLARAGHLEEAEVLIKRFPQQGEVSLWRSLLGGCSIHGNVEIGERAAKQCWEWDAGNYSDYVSLWNIYAAAGKWARKAAIEERLEREVCKETGRTWIEVKTTMHSFMVDDKEHPEILEIYAELNRLSVQITEAGYVSQPKLMLHQTKGFDFLPQ